MSEQARGYVILEIEDPDWDQSTFPSTMDAIRSSLGESRIALVSRIHAAIGEDGLRESVDYLTGPTPPRASATADNTRATAEET